jgi:hypothetical protein
VLLAYPQDPTLSVVSIAIPLLDIECPTLGIIDPISDIKAALAKLYNYGMRFIFEPVWDILERLFNALKAFAPLGVLDLSLPVFDLTISDLFLDDLPARIKLIVTNLYNNAKAELEAALNTLKIPFPLFTEIVSPEKEIQAIVSQILNSLWDSLFKLIGRVIGLIKTGLLAYDIVRLGRPFPTAPLWQAAVDAVIGQILSKLLLPPSMDTILDAIQAYAQSIYDRIPTYAELMAIIPNFELPIFGFPLDWQLPINIRVNAPNLDFVQILDDMKTWINNFLISLVAEFIQAVTRILSLFGLSFALPSLSVPFTLCAVKTS